MSLDSHSLTFQVDAEAARAFENASEDQREEIRRAIEARLKKIGEVGQDRDASDDEARLRERRERLRRTQGIWRDRNDLPDLAEMRAEWDRRLP